MGPLCFIVARTSSAGRAASFIPASTRPQEVSDAEMPALISTTELSTWNYTFGPDSVSRIR